MRNNLTPIDARKKITYNGRMDTPKRRGRSPNYPQLTLSEAIEKVRMGFSVEHFHSTSREVIAKDIGYQGLNGASLTAIAAMRHYDLLQNEGDGLRISDDAVSLFELPKDDLLRQRALVRVALAPPLFAELFREFGDLLPSEATLRHWLIKRGFMSKAADEVIRIYRENFELADGAIQRYAGPDGKVEEESMPRQQTESPSQTPQPTKTVYQGAMRLSVPVQARTYAFDISIPREVKGELRLIGEFSHEDLERLKKALAGQLAMIEAALE